jgi:hypothetical protein
MYKEIWRKLSRIYETHTKIFSISMMLSRKSPFILQTTASYHVGKKPPNTGSSRQRLRRSAISAFLEVAR